LLLDVQKRGLVVVFEISGQITYFILIGLATLFLFLNPGLLKRGLIICAETSVPNKQGTPHDLVKEGQPKSHRCRNLKPGKFCECAFMSAPS
jgi:hypothetical protein